VAVVEKNEATLSALADGWRREWPGLEITFKPRTSDLWLSWADFRVPHPTGEPATFILVVSEAGDLVLVDDNRHRSELDPTSDWVSRVQEEVHELVPWNLDLLDCGPLLRLWRKHQGLTGRRG
jgi:hypothetical protein